ncbi:MAG: hypothetical protein H7328_11225 [Bdellovibrio sp.]|nr:hypothetical protein [Bdellovibrio sp.]
MISRMLNDGVKMILILGISLQFSGCTDFLRGKPEKKDTLFVNKESLSCLKEVAVQFKTFLKSESNPKDIDQSFTCLDQTLNEFQNRVEGRQDAQSFSSDDLYEIFNSFIQDAQISKDSSVDLLLLKAAVLGGSNQKITKIEISDLRNFLMVLKPELKSLIPYAKIFNFKKGTTAYSKALLRDAFAQLNMSLKNLLKVTNVARSDYQFDDFKRLVTNLSMIEAESNDLLQLATKIKNILVGKYVLQTEADYFLFVDNLTEVLRLYATQVQGTIHFEIVSKDGMNEAIEYIQSWLILLENSVQYKNKQLISLDTLDPVVEEIAKQNILPVSISGPTLINFYKMLIVRVFDSGRTGELNKLTGLTQVHFSNIKREVAIYRLYMNFIDQVSTNEQRVPIHKIQTSLKSFDPKTLEFILKPFDKPEQIKILNGFEELKSEFLGSRPVVYRFKKMVIAANQSVWDQNWADLARGFYTKMLARELLIGWGISPVTVANPTGYASKEIAHSFMTEEGLIQWYAEFKDFGIESKAFDPRSMNAGSESFKQADLLTYSANGDSKMGFLESIQYVNMLVSGGGETLTEIQAGLARAQCNLKELDVFGFPWNSEACAVLDIKRNFGFYFSNLSWLNAYVQKMNDSQFAEFYFELMEVTRIDAKYRGSQIQTADLRSMSIILYYIESLYAVYDADGNAAFSSQEIREAYAGRFKAFANKYAMDNAKAQIDEFSGFLSQTVYGCYSQEDLIRESFVYLVFNGRTPTKDDLTPAWKLPCIGTKPPLIDFSSKGEVERKTMISTFKILKAVLGSKK